MIATSRVRYTIPHLPIALCYYYLCQKMGEIFPV